VKFVVRYEVTRVEHEIFEVDVEADSAFEADVKVRGGPLNKVAGVGVPWPTVRGPRPGLTTRRVIEVTEKV
jgi:hypothetical protein